MIPAAERLAVSRERLRLALAPDAAAGTGADTLGTLARALDLPQLSLAAEMSRAAITPLAQRRPWTLVLVAAAAGAVLVRLRPWRGLLQPALLTSALPLLAQATLRLPPGLVTQLLSLLQKKP